MIESIPTKPGARDQLLSDLKTVIQDAEAWLTKGSQMTGEELQLAKAKFERTLTTAKAELIRIEENVVQKTKEAAKATDEYVHENPWKAVGIGAAAGLVIGLLIARK
jgi:ElaB/YqjD/DUF883 family membrane-anchored ribosome-binding protein